MTPSRPVSSERLAPESGSGWPLSLRTIALLTLAAAVLRLFRLDFQPLWVDEIMTYQQCRPDLDLDYWRQVRHNVQGPLYLSILWPLVRISTGELMLRLPAALAGIATIPALVWCAGRLLPARTVKLGAWLLVLSPFHVWYAQEARGYAFVMLFAVLASGILLGMMRDGPRLRPALAYALFAALGVWSNMSMVFLWAAHGLTVLAVARPRTGRTWGLWALAFGISLLAILPWILQSTNYWAIDRMVPGADPGHALRGETTFSPFAVPFAGYALFFGYSLGPSLRELHQPDPLAAVLAHAPLIGLAALVAGAALLAGLWRAPDHRRWLLLWIALPLVAVVLLSLRNIKPFNPRYLAVAFPWLLLLAAHGPASLGDRRIGRGLAVVLAGLMLWSTVQHHFVARYHKADLRSAAAWVAASPEREEPVLCPGTAQVLRYYYRGPAPVLDHFGEPILWTADDVRSYLARKLAGSETAKIVLARSWYADPRGHFPEVLRRDGTLVEEEMVNGVRMYRWRPHRDGGADRSPPRTGD